MTMLDLADTCKKHNVGITVSCKGPLTITVRRGDCWVVQDIYTNEADGNAVDCAVQLAINEMIEEIDYIQNASHS